MSTTTFTLVALGPNTTAQDLLFHLKSLPQGERPIYVGECHHWIHSPKLSSTALVGTGPIIQKWDYLIITTNSKPTLPNVSKTWSITTASHEETLAALSATKQRHATTPASPLPQGWSSADHSALDAAIPPPDLEASLSMSSIPMGAPSTSPPVALKDFIPTFTKSHPGPIQMFNLLSYLPEQRPRYMQYVAAFQESVGIKYGGEPVVIGFGVQDWSSKEAEQGEEGEWEDAALIWYPSLWHFGKMLDDEGYVEVDRKFKQGVLRDNPLVCCTEVELDG